MRRLDAVLANAGVGSRREVRGLIQRGEVRVNGIPAVKCDMKIEQTDRVTVRGSLIRHGGTYLMMNKPVGYVCTSDSGERNVFELVPDEYPRRALFCAGRLDKDTSGLLLLTDDGAFCHNVISPSRHVRKVYRAVLSEPARTEYAEKFMSGIVLRDGYRTLPAKIEFTQDPRTVLIYLSEGKYHQVRRMIAACGNHVISLCRLSVGPLAVGDLPEGEVRELSSEEISFFSDTSKLCADQTD